VLNLRIVVIDDLLERIIVFHRFLPIRYASLKLALNCHTLVAQMLAIFDHTFRAEENLIFSMRTLLILTEVKLDSTSAAVAVLFILGCPPIHGGKLYSLDHISLVTL
jgi:hypothetical protein